MSNSADADGYVYATLATPQVLSASTTYYYGSLEATGVDHFYEYDTSITTTSAASSGELFYYKSSSAYGTFAVSSRCYGPINFKYHY